MKSLDEILDSLKGEAIKEITKEFKDLLKSAKSDAVGFIKETAQNTIRWLEMLGNGQLERSEVEFLLKKQKKTAQIFANSQKIIIKTRVQKIAYRLLDIGIDVLTGAIGL